MKRNNIANMWKALLGFFPAIVQLINNIFGLFKKSADEEAEKKKDAFEKALEKSKKDVDKRYPDPNTN